MECLHVSRGIWLPQAVHTLRFPSPFPFPFPLPLPPAPPPAPPLLALALCSPSLSSTWLAYPSRHGIPARQDRPARSQLQRSKEKLIVPLRPLIERACASLEGSDHAEQVDSSAPAWECSDFARSCTGSDAH